MAPAVERTRQRKRSTAWGSPTTTPSRPLPTEQAQRLGQAFGHDFARVQIHDDLRAQAAARALQEEAFALGSHVFFARGAYRPGTREGDRLLIHELTHVVQYEQGRIGADGPAPDHAEQEARANEDRILPRLQRVDNTPAAASSAEETAPDADPRAALLAAAEELGAGMFASAFAEEPPPEEPAPEEAP